MISWLELEAAKEILEDALEYILGTPTEDEERRNAIVADITYMIVIIKRQFD